MSDFFVVGIGASAGGIAALKQFFEQVPADSEMAYMVILHLSSDHDSQLAQVLQLVTPMPVIQVTEKQTIAPNCIYVIPPAKHLTMENGYVDVSPNMVIEDRRAPVDIFFRSLAESQRSHAICVVLSGTGANGSMGLKRVKEKGGAVYVQNPREAEFGEMARNAIATDLVDEVLNVADIPAKIIAYKNSAGSVYLPAADEPRPETLQQALRTIFTQLRLHTGHDFSNYKQATLLRRIGRRVQVRNLPDLPAYATYIQEHPEETTHLLKDLLISVTNFFRDAKAFEQLERQVLPELLAGKTADDRVRIWVAGCATGEEAYTLAMLCADHTFDVPDAPKIQIFATDIDADAIAQGREGFYTINDAADVSVERLRRYFNKEGEGYRVRREIREMILFAHHNFLKDPPFSHLDLVTCRNVLIYLNQAAQERVMNVFHFALEPGGYLFLGNSETVVGNTDRYAVVSRDHHIYQTRHVASRSYPIPESIPAIPSIPSASYPALKNSPEKGKNRISFGALHQRMLEQYAPPSIVVNSEYDIVHVSERAGRYLQTPGGDISHNLLDHIRQELRLELRSALYQATQRQIAIDARGLKVRIEDTTETINILVRPVTDEEDPANGFMLVIFEPSTGAVSKEEVVVTSDVPVTKHLEEELIRLKTMLRNANEQHEFSTEELRSSNEELQAMIEELRSAAEELETSKEELQSINEELVTVNQELKVKVEEASMSSNNLQNLINSADIGTIFLDRSFRVMLFTPAARSIFNLIPSDHGRLLSDITNRLEEDGIISLAETVLENLTPIEQMIRTTDGFTYLMRLAVYRTEEDHIQGVVLAFVNVTDQLLAERALMASESRMRLIIESVKDYAIFTTDTDRKIISWNSGAAVMFGYNEADIIGQPVDLLFTPEDRENEDPANELTLALAQGYAENERWHSRRDGSRFYGSGAVTPMRDDKGNLIGFVKIMRDLTEQKRADEALRTSEERLRITTESATDYAIITLNKAGLIDAWSQGAELIFGYTAAEAIGKPGHIIFTPEDIAAKVPEEEMETARRNGRALDERWHRRSDGSRFYMSGVMRPILNPEFTGYVKVAREVTEQKMAEEVLRISEERYRIALQSAGMAAWDWHIAQNEVLWNEQHYILLGLVPPAEETPKKAEFFMEFVHPDDLAAVSEELTRAVVETGLYAVPEFRIVKTNGEQRWMSGYARVVERREGAAVRMVGVMYDVTSRVLAAQIMRDRQIKLEIAQRAARLGIWGYDLVKSQGIATPELMELTGYPDPGETWELEIFLKMVYPEDRPIVTAAIHKAASDFVGLEVEFRMKGPEGNLQWMLMRGSYIPAYDKMNPTLMGSLIDITERKAFEQQKDEFIGIASHELKTPVTSIKVYTEVLQEMFNEAGDEKSAELMGKMDIQVDRLTGLIQSLLDTTSATEGKLQLQREHFEMDELIRETTEIMQRTAADHRIILELTAGPQPVFADRERIRQVLINLIGNGVKYSPGADKIVIRSSVKDGNVITCVEDYGIGIEDDVQPKVFERFFRAADADISSFQGLGLGLFIAADIIKRHSGTIWVESTKGKGSQFCFTIPLETRK